MKTKSNSIRIALFVLLGMLCGFHAKATQINTSVYINRGRLLTVDSTYIPYFAFNSSTNFNRQNERIIIQIDDTLNLKIINTDSLQHGFDIKGYSGISRLIPAKDSAVVSVTFKNAGAKIYFDYTASGKYRYMGLGGMIIVKNPNVNSSDFFWNMKDHQKSFNQTLNLGGSVNWSLYYPEYFTINGNSNPHINQDMAAKVLGNVGDTIHIYLVNTGESLHSIHFHGYHAQVVFSSKFPNHVGRSKDTFAVYKMETVVLELIPDQTGEYPVHDHNLVAVSGGNIYPNGMFLTILIQ